MVISRKIINLVFGSRCNLHCKYCFETNWSKTDYTFDPIIIEYLKKKYGGFSPKDLTIWFFGGEPLLYWKYIEQCLIGFKECKFGKAIVTNGTLLTKEIVDILNSNNVSVILSHDGKDTKDLRGIDVLETHLDLIKSINDLHISTVVTNGNTIDSIEQYFKSIFKDKSIHIIYNRFKPTQSNEHLISNLSAEEFVNDMYDNSFKNNMGVSLHPKYGIHMCCDGLYRNPLTGNIVAKINKDTLQLENDSEAFNKEKSLSKCLFDKCEYQKYCSYPKLQIEDNTYCREIAKAVSEQYLDPFKAVERITLYLGGECNNVCVYCRDRFKPHHRTEANKDNINELIPFLNKFKHLTRLTYLGGEPLIYMDYIKTITDNTNCLRYSVITNGKELINDDTYNYLLDNNFTLCLSHDGINSNLTRSYNVFDNKKILSRVKTFNRLGKLTISSVITEYNWDVLTTSRYFIDLFGEEFRWRLMYVNGEEFTKKIPRDKTIESIYKFLRLYKYSKLAANVLYNELRRFLTVGKVIDMFMDLNKVIGYQPLDTTHPFSKENYINYVANMNNKVYCKDCKINANCIRNPSRCSESLLALRIETNNILEQIMTENGYSSHIRFRNYVGNFI